MAESVTTNDPRLAAVEHAVKVKALAQLAREIGIGEALAVIAKAMDGTKDETATPRELAVAGRQAHRAQVVADMARLEKDGRGRDAALFLARKHAADVRDPVEVETLKNKFRRWRRAEKRASARLPAA
jgi:IMP cyclohydrolase